MTAVTFDNSRTTVGELFFFDMLQNGNWGKDFIRDEMTRWARELVPWQPNRSLELVHETSSVEHPDEQPHPEAWDRLTDSTQLVAIEPDDPYEFKSRRSYFWQRLKNKFKRKPKEYYGNN